MSSDWLLAVSNIKISLDRVLVTQYRPNSYPTSIVKIVASMNGAFGSYVGTFWPVCICIILTGQSVISIWTTEITCVLNMCVVIEIRGMFLYHRLYRDVFIPSVIYSTWDIDITYTLYRYLGYWWLSNFDQNY